MCRFKGCLIIVSMICHGVFANEQNALHILDKQQLVELSSQVHALGSGETTEIYLDYSVTDNASVTGMGINVFFNSKQVAINRMPSVFAEGKTVQSIQFDADNLDGDDSTDAVVKLHWENKMGKWPQRLNGKLRLATIELISRSHFSGTSINIASTKSAPGYRFRGNTLMLLATQE